MTHTRNWQKLIIAAITAGVGTIGYGDVLTGWNQTGPGPYSYSDTANWIGGVINNTWDSSLTLTAAQSVTVGSDIALSSGMSFNYAGDFSLNITSTGGPRTLTLGGDISVASKAVNFGSSTSANAVNIDLGGATRTFSAASGKILTFNNSVTGNGGLVVNGAGTIVLKGANTYTGSTQVTGGQLTIGANGGSAGSDVTVIGSTLKFDNGGVTAGASVTRAASVTLNNAVLNIAGVNGSNTLDVISGALTASRGHSIVTLTPGTKNATLQAGSYVSTPGATVLFRGSALGVNPAASAVASSTNILFSNGVALGGGTGAPGTTTVGVMKGAYGDAVNSGNGSGLLTYDSTNGVRLLGNSEYTSSITSGQTQLDNVRFQNSSGTPIIQTLTGDTSIGSLTFGVSGTPGSGVTINGSGKLTIASGMLYASQSVATPTTADAMLISGPTLSMNNTDAYFTVFTSGINTSGGTNGLLQIDTAITEASSLTKAGTGVMKFTGSAANTYTGTTYLNAGYLNLAKSVSDGSIAGDLVVNGGVLVTSTGNQIANTSSVTMNAGVWHLKTSTNSGSSTSETIGNLIMNGGTLNAGADGSSTGSFTTNDVTLNGGRIDGATGYMIKVNGNMTLSGGTISVGRSNANSYNSVLTLAQGLTIANTESAPYTAMTLDPGISATTRGGALMLKGDVTFVGNSTNANTVTIDAPTGTQLGLIGLANGTRTFNIGDGAAANDLTINAGIVNGTVIDSTVSNGGLTKTGAGTLALNGNNTYTGLTTISQGRLAINGSHASDILVAGGTLAGTGTISGAVTISSGGTLAAGNSVGTLTVNSLTLDSGSAMQFEFDSSGNDLVIVSGTDSLIINGGIIHLIIDDALTLTGSYHLFQYTGALGGSIDNLTLANSGYQLTLSTDGTNNYIDLQASNIPEPAAVSLLAAGSAALLMRRRRSV